MSFAAQPCVRSVIVLGVVLGNYTSLVLRKTSLFDQSPVRVAEFYFINSMALMVP